MTVFTDKSDSIYSIEVKAVDRESVSSVHSKDVENVNDGRKSPWGSIWISIVMQFLVGVEISIYYMSMWPYLHGLDSSATMDFLGWVVAACSAGCSVANPIFGWWNQKTMSTTNPTMFGLALCAIGQALYGLLPSFGHSNIKWYMLLARFLTGFGSGTLSVLRAYGAQASIPKDRLKAISLGTAGFVLGLSFGPVIQAFFTPIGDGGFGIGPIQFNMYSIPAFVMAGLSLAAAVFMKVFFNEDYAGIVSEDEKNADPFMVIPKYSKIPAFICIYLWMVSCMISTNIEVISTPVSTVFYDWKDSQSVVYNGILQSLACIVSVIINVLIGSTRIGKIDTRKQVIFGLLVFMAFHICNYPFPFYSGPLHKLPSNVTDTSSQGGCDSRYTWCDTSVRTPLWLYIFCYVVFYGIAFPFVGSPSGSLFSEILGPRKQGMMQGMYAFGGSFAQFVAPIVATMLFQRSGYKYVIVTQMCTVGLALLLMIIFYPTIKPIKLRPEAGSGKAFAYKRGLFYRF